MVRVIHTPVANSGDAFDIKNMSFLFGGVNGLICIGSVVEHADKTKTFHCNNLPLPDVGKARQSPVREIVYLPETKMISVLNDENEILFVKLERDGFDYTAKFQSYYQLSQIHEMLHESSGTYREMESILSFKIVNKFLEKAEHPTKVTDSTSLLVAGTNHRLLVFVLGYINSEKPAPLGRKKSSQMSMMGRKKGSTASMMSSNHNKQSTIRTKASTNTMNDSLARSSSSEMPSDLLGGKTIVPALAPDTSISVSPSRPISQPGVPPGPVEEAAAAGSAHTSGEPSSASSELGPIDRTASGEETDMANASTISNLPTSDRQDPSSQPSQSVGGRKASDGSMIGLAAILPRTNSSVSQAPTLLENTGPVAPGAAGSRYGIIGFVELNNITHYTMGDPSQESIGLFDLTMTMSTGPMTADVNTISTLEGPKLSNEVKYVSNNSWMEWNLYRIHEPDDEEEEEEGYEGGYEGNNDSYYGTLEPSSHGSSDKQQEELQHRQNNHHDLKDRIHDKHPFEGVDQQQQMQQPQMQQQPQMMTKKDSSIIVGDEIGRGADEKDEMGEEEQQPLIQRPVEQPAPVEQPQQEEEFFDEEEEEEDDEPAEMKLTNFTVAKRYERTKTYFKHSLKKIHYF